MSDSGKPKLSARASEEFIAEYEKFLEDSSYESKSEAMRDALQHQMERKNSNELQYNEEFYNAFSTYASGLADRNERVTAAGIKLLSDIDEELGRLAERELDKIE